MSVDLYNYACSGFEYFHGVNPKQYLEYVQCIYELNGTMWIAFDRLSVEELVALLLIAVDDLELAK